METTAIVTTEGVTALPPVLAGSETPAIRQRVERFYSLSHYGYFGSLNTVSTHL